MKAAEVLARVGQALGGEVNEEKIIQAVIAGGTELSDAEVGRFLPAEAPVAPANNRQTGEPRLASELVVPVRSGTGEVLGALFFGHSAPDAFTPRVEALIAAVASQAAIAIDNSRLMAALDNQRAHAEDVSRQYRFLAESMPQLVWTADADGRVDYVNERWTVFSGRPVNAILRDGWRDIVHPDDRERTLEAWARAVSGAVTLEITCRLGRADGVFRWHLVRAYSLRSETRRIIKWFGTCTDIHDQKRFEDSQRLLSESSRVLAASFDLESTLGTVASLVASWFIGYCIIDLLGEAGLQRIAAAHVDPDRQPLIDEMRTLSPGADRGDPLWQVLTSRRTEVCNRITEEAIRHAARSERHAEIRRRLGTTGYMITPLLAGGQAVGTLMIGLTGDEPFAPDDVRPVEELAYRIAMSVTNARAFVQARDANRLKDEFLAIVSHELRTPLNAMRGWLSLLKSARLSEEQRAHALAVIERNMGAQTQLVEDLLDISRIVSGRMRLNVQPVEVTAVVGTAIDSVRLAAEARGILIEAALEPASGLVHGDPDRLQQIVWNLLSNAIKFTPRGGRVTVMLRRSDAHVELIVSDTGQGISAAFLPHVFERFRQGDSTTTRPFGGLGLGLAIVRHLAEIHGGTVTAASDGEGRGATFTLSLPAAITA
ncbi:MAG TPA: ATP-binding protein [Vicinamibacterales bacterium]|nr:ATP-binding protein [Vicinamibacterales bacterium]